MLPPEVLRPPTQPAPAPAAAGGRTTGPTLALLRSNWASLLVIVPLTVTDVAIDSGLTLSYKFLIDYAIVPRNRDVLVLILCCLGGSVLVSSAISLYRDRYYAAFVARVVGDLRSAAFERCQRLPLGASVGSSPADLMARLSTDIVGIETWLTGAVHGMIAPALSMVVGSVMLFFILTWPLALASMLIWPLMLMGPRLIAPRAAKASYEKKAVEGELLARVEETIDARREVKAYGLEGFAKGRFDGVLGRLTSSASRTGFLGFLVERTTVISICTLQVVIISAGSWMAYRGMVSVGSLVTFFSLYWNLGWWLVVLGRSGPAVVSAVGSMRRLDELLDAPQDPPDPPRAVSLGPLRRELRFDDVTFAYPGREPVLRGASFKIERGEFIAVVGPSGSGKSTVLNLLARFYEPTSGKILIDGVAAASATTRSLRKQIALVFQETYLFDVSVRENIRLGRLDATDEEVEAAAREAEIHDTIAALPGGYGAILSEGAQLSGGQRQRLAIARALLRDAPILLLDEATSALDPTTEAAVNQTLLRAGKGRTTVFVTHRLAAAVTADRIIVVQRGGIAEQGSHAELLEREGVYAELWRKQNGFILSGDGAAAQVSADRLRHIPLLRPLDDEQLTALAGQLVSIKVGAGQPVISEGEPGSLFYLIARGLVTVSKAGPDGEPVEVARLGDGDQFGELALLNDSPRGATVTARTDCLFLTLTREQFRELLRMTPDVREMVERIANERQNEGPSSSREALPDSPGDTAQEIGE
jgi:ATP-binding cassette, subfamily B, bacterial